MSKFCYEEGEINIVECQCELCLHYNDGKRSEVCPTTQLDEIVKNMICCPSIKKRTYFDLEDED